MKIYPFITNYEMDTIPTERRITFSSLHRGIMFDLMWSDPSEEHFGWKTSPREAGYTFGNDVTQKCVYENSLSLIVRGHQVVMDVRL